MIRSLESRRQSSIERGESPQNSTDRMQSNFIRNLMTPRENQRANENDVERQSRIETERTRYRQALESTTSNPEDFANQWANDYINKERLLRGLYGSNNLDFNNDQIKVIAQIGIDAEAIVHGYDGSHDLEGVIRATTENIAFDRIIQYELGRLPVNRASPEWQQFCAESYDKIVETYKLGQREIRVQMLADIMRYDTPNRYNISLQDSKNYKEYKTIVLLTLNEFDAWKSKKSSSTIPQE